jgi:16S rRNA (adenine1518-N6/adenine1519-N6)-dimethyltransferase
MSQEIIKQYRIRAKKSLGQNFLVDEEKLEAISECITIEWENIIEVWPWYGALTEKLLHKKPRSLHLVELDADMIEILDDRKGRGELNTNNTEFKIFQQDVLEFVPEFKKYSVIANIPYYITSPILHHFLYEIKNTPEKMVILMQKDVGDKILWGKKNKSSVISLMVQKKCHVSEKLFVPKESFHPIPKVESSVLLFETHEKYGEIDDEKFLKFIKVWFAQPRKKLVKNLVSGGYSSQKIEDFLCQQSVDNNFRGEDVDMDFWIDLYGYLIIDKK